VSLVAETERLRLLEWDEPRKAEFARVTNTPAVMRWLGGVADEKGIAAALERLDSYQRDFGFTFWALERKADGALLGFCGLKRANAPGAEPLHSQHEVGWRLREDAWGQGYAKEAAIASLDLAFGRFGAPHVIALTALGNLASQGLMLRLGMRRMRQFDYVDRRFGPDDAPNPQLVFRIDRQDWPAARAAALS
jgi:RimJ/RimL family protein N-acetyltransferase